MDDRHERGVAAYASQLGVRPDEVEAWFTQRMGERFGREAINAAADARLVSGEQVRGSPVMMSLIFTSGLLMPRSWRTSLVLRS